MLFWPGYLLSRLIILGNFNFNVLNYFVHEQLWKAFSYCTIILLIWVVLILLRFISKKVFLLKLLSFTTSVVNNYFSYHNRVRVDSYDAYIEDFHYAVNVWYHQISYLQSSIYTFLIMCNVRISLLSHVVLQIVKDDLWKSFPRFIKWGSPTLQRLSSYVGV